MSRRSLQAGGRVQRRTSACRRRLPASATLPLPGAPDAWRSALVAVLEDLPVKIFVTCFACVLLVSCSQSSGVLRMGPDTYTVSAAAAPARGSSSGARKIALTEANQYCAQMGKEILVTNVGTASTNIYGAGSAEVTFRCFAKGDPELQRLEYLRAPDIVIEDRRK